jgi:hypothetical protein
LNISALFSLSSAATAALFSCVQQPLHALVSALPVVKEANALIGSLRYQKGRTGLLSWKTEMKKGRVLTSRHRHPSPARIYAYAIKSRPPAVAAGTAAACGSVRRP